MDMEAGIALLAGVIGIAAATVSTFRAITRTPGREDALRMVAAASLIWTAGLACVAVLMAGDTTYQLWMGWLPYAVPYVVALGMAGCSLGQLRAPRAAAQSAAAPRTHDSRAMLAG